MSRILVTGAGGFIGPALIAALQEARLPVRASLRRETSLLPGVEYTITRDIGPETDWRRALMGIGTVIHLAARGPQQTDDLTDYRRVNEAGTRRLAEAAAESGVRRFIYLSSVKAASDHSLPGQPLREDKPARPVDAYGQSKLGGEDALRTVASATGMEAIILRPPLIYGPDAAGNFRRLCQAIAQGRRLPLGAAQNRRSMIARANLVSALVGAAQAPGRQDGTYYVCDGPAPSLRDLALQIASIIGHHPRLWPVPPTILRLGLSAAGQGHLAASFLNWLEVDDTIFRQKFSWHPPVSMIEALNEAVPTLAKI